MLEKTTTPRGLPLTVTLVTFALTLILLARGIWLMAQTSSSAAQPPSAPIEIHNVKITKFGKAGEGMAINSGAQTVDHDAAFRYTSGAGLVLIIGIFIANMLDRQRTIFR